MALYSTDLLIENVPVSYMVYQEGNRLFFKPERMVGKKDVPVFWVVKTGDTWNPINISDKKFIEQVRADILKHQVD